MQIRLTTVPRAIQAHAAEVKTRARPPPPANCLDRVHASTIRRRRVPTRHEASLTVPKRLAAPNLGSMKRARRHHLCPRPLSPAQCASRAATSRRWAPAERRNWSCREALRILLRVTRARKLNSFLALAVGRRQRHGDWARVGSHSTPSGPKPARRRAAATLVDVSLHPDRRVAAGIFENLSQRAAIPRTAWRAHEFVAQLELALSQVYRVSTLPH